MDQQEQPDEIIEAEEVIEDNEAALNAEGVDAGGATALLSLEELIKNHIESIDKLRND